MLTYAAHAKRGNVAQNARALRITVNAIASPAKMSVMVFNSFARFSNAPPLGYLVTKGYIKQYVMVARRKKDAKLGKVM